MIKHILDTTKKIIDGSLHYQVFTKELTNSKDYEEAEKGAIRTLVNALLNRYFRYLYSLTAGEESDLTIEEVLALSLYSYNVEKEVIKITYEEFLGALPASSQFKIEEKFPESAFPIRIPQGFQKESIALNYATRFSTPLHLVEQLVQDIGKKNILKFLSVRPLDSYGLLNRNNTNPEQFFTTNKTFIPGARNGEFRYESHEFLKKTKPYNDNEVIIVSQSLLDIAHEVDNIKPTNLLFVQYEDSSLLLILALLYPELEIHFMADDQKSRYILQHLVRKFELNNVKYVTAIAQTYDLVMTTINGSNINGNIRHRDFYYRLKPLDAYVNDAKAQLQGIKDYVNDHGTLIFVTTTALRSETHYQALGLIRDYPEYTLLKEKQYFHFNQFHETIYYALFKKGPDAKEI